MTVNNYNLTKVHWIFSCRKIEANSVVDFQKYLKIIMCKF